jgi:phosphoglycolate phosphatase
VRDAVLFDLDGVLVDSRTAIAGCLNEALAAHGFAPRPETGLHRFIGPPLAAGFGELTGAEPDSALVADCIATYRRHYATASLRDTTAVPGIDRALAELADGHALAVATSKAAAFAEPILEALGLRAFFAAVAGPDTGALDEDKADTVRRALDALGGPVRAVMVGDRSFDVTAARANGLAAIGVTWGIGDAAELAGADALVDDPAELPPVARRLLAG